MLKRELGLFGRNKLAITTKHKFTFSYKDCGNDELYYLIEGER